MKSREKTAESASIEIVCQTCGARYDRLPAYTCPRCGTPLCVSGCDGCTAKCGLRKRHGSP